MRVLHVIPAVAERYGGPSAAVVSMARALRGVGVEARIATTDADGPHGRLEVPLGVPTSFGGEGAIFFRRQWGEALKLSAPLARWLAANVSGFDVVHVHAVFSHACVSAGRASRRNRVPYLVRPLGTLDPWSLEQNAIRKKLFWRLGGRALLEGAEGVHYTSEQERRRTEGPLGLSRGVVIPLGVDELFFTDPRDPAPSSAGSLGIESPYVLFLGRLHPKKNVEALLAAFAALPFETAPLRLILAGDGERPYVDGLRREVSRLSLAPRVLFTGWVSGEEKVRLLRGASLFALPSSQENFAISVAEAMACGVPVIVSPDTSMADEVESRRAGWVVSADSRALADTLAAAMSDPDERRTRGERGAALARERFRWSRVAAALKDLYARLSEGGAAA